MDFGAALDGLKAGMKMRRDSWKEDVYLAIVDGPMGTQPQIAIVDGGEWALGYRADGSDLLADNWQEFTP
jgi:hypothetical protein